VQLVVGRDHGRRDTPALANRDASVADDLAAHAVLIATATAFIFEPYGRNPQIITRWAPHVTATRQDKITNPGKLRKTRQPR
jgi:hypothetical protein